MPLRLVPRIAGCVIAVTVIASGGTTALAQDRAVAAGDEAITGGSRSAVMIDPRRWLRVDLDRGGPRGEAEAPRLRLILGDGTGIAVVTDPGGDAPSPRAAILPRSDRMAQEEIARHADAEIGLAIGIAKGVDLVPAYGLHWTGNEAEGIDADISHRFTFGARIGF